MNMKPKTANLLKKVFVNSNNDDIKSFEFLKLSIILSSSIFMSLKYDHLQNIEAIIKKR